MTVWPVFVVKLAACPPGVDSEYVPIHSEHEKKRRNELKQVHAFGLRAFVTAAQSLEARASSQGPQRHNQPVQQNS